jgi:hypothetical protein
MIPNKQASTGSPKRRSTCENFLFHILVRDSCSDGGAEKRGGG